MATARTDDLGDRTERLRKRHPELFGTHVRQRVAIIGDPAFLRTFAGQVTWATAVNLVGRLYRGVDELHLDVDPDLRRLTRVFFPNQETRLLDTSLALLDELGEQEAHYLVRHGPRRDLDDSWVVCYVGRRQGASAHSVSAAGNGWLAFIDSDAWVVLPDDVNPIGPIVAACQATSEVYRMLYMPKGSLAGRPEASIFSAFDYEFRADARGGSPPMPSTLALPLTHIAGAGAGAMAVLLLLDSVPIPVESKGLRVVDKDTLDGTNSNRCVLAVPRDEGRAKVEVVRERIDGTRLGLEPIPAWWEEFTKGPAWSAEENFRLVVSCVDKYEARQAVQFDPIPQLVFTTGTGDFLLTVSRHRLDDGRSCALCYQPRERVGPGCGQASDGAQAAFEVPVEPSIGFVSLLAGVFLGAELLKEIVPAWHGGRLRNTLRYQVLRRRSKAFESAKEDGCGCGSRFAAAAYREVWGGV